MSEINYEEGVEFIKKNSGSPEEKKHRMQEWRQEFAKLGKNIASERASVYTK